MLFAENLRSNSLLLAHSKEGEPGTKQLDFLKEVFKVLTCGPDFHTNLSNVVRLSVPFLSDLCVIDILDKNSTILNYAVSCRGASRDTSGRRQ